MKAKILILSLALCMALVILFGCNTNRGEESSAEAPATGVSITETKVNADLHLIVTYSDGTTEDLGYVGVEVPGKSVVKSEVNEDIHLIVTYSDGTTEDLGYVGVEVEVEVEVVPPMYTVVFKDADGNVLATEQAYKGTAARAPQAPEILGKTFTGWSEDITNVQGDMTVTAQYTAAATFTVTFKDADGTVLKTEQVLPGMAATAPANPTKAGMIFDKWDKAYNNITGDTVVTAVYREKKTLTVTFQDYSGVTLGTASVKEGENATAPVAPTREGYTFTGWSSSLSNITSNKTVKAQYKLNSGKNIVDISYSVSGSELTVTYTLKGTVQFANMDMEITVPNGLTVKSVKAEVGAANQVGNEILFSMFSTTGQDITAETKLLTVTFTIGSGVKNVTLDTEVTAIGTALDATTDYKVIGEAILIKK